MKPAMAEAVRRSEIGKPASCHPLRPSFATHIFAVEQPDITAIWAAGGCVLSNAFSAVDFIDGTGLTLVR